MRFGCCLFWKKLEPVVRLELRVEASSSSSWFVELFVLHFVSRLGATHRPILGVDPRKNDASTGRIGAESHQHVLRSAGGFAGAQEGSRRLDPARSRWSPGPNNLKTTRGGEVRVRFWVSAHLSSELELVSKGLCHHFLGVCVCVCVRVSVGPSNK